jgi:predicted transcriptional regulator
MRTNKSNSRMSFKKGQSKDTTLQTQIKIIFHYLLKHTATNTMVSYATNVSQKNICRIKRNLEKEGKLQEVERKKCKITGHRASYLTTNNKLFKKK